MRSPSTFAGRCRVTTKYPLGSSLSNYQQAGGRRRGMLEQRVDHGVADEEDTIVRNSGAAQIVIGRFARDKKSLCGVGRSD